MDDSTKLISPKVRFSYVHIFEPKAMEGSTDKKYSINIIIPKSEKVFIKQVQKAIDAAKAAGKDSKWAGKIPSGLKTPLRDGDEDRPEDPAYENAYFINATSKTKPGIIGRDKKEITDEEEVYSGCYGRVSLNFFPFNANGNKGIGAGLQNVQKLGDGEAFSGRASATDDFSDDLEDEDDDLLG